MGPIEHKPWDVGRPDRWVVGDLASWPVVDMLLWMHQAQRTAMLRLGPGLAAGVLFFRAGQLYRAEWGHLRGEEALSALLALTSGNFMLLNRDIPEANPNITTPTQELLLRCTVASDETARGTE